MESLIGYGSEDELDEPTYRKKAMFRQADVNYDEVHMDLGEDSSNSPKSGSKHHSRSEGNLYEKGKEDKSRRGSDDYKSKYEQERYSPKYEKVSKSEYKSRDKYRNEDRNENRSQRYEKDYRSDRSYDDKDCRKDERSKEYRRKDSHDSEEKYKGSRTYDSNENNERDNKRYSHEHIRDKSYDSRDNSRGSKDYNSQSTSRDSRSYSSRDGRSYDSRDNGKNDIKSRKASSPTKHRSRSPVTSDTRSRRSNSRDKSRSGYSSKFFERSGNKMDRLEKLGIEIEHASTSSHEPADTKDVEKNRFYMPGITGRFTEQIQRRKLLWQKKESKPDETLPQSRPKLPVQPGKVWQNTTFAQDTDGKVANKFKRLMGIKGAGGQEPAKPGMESLKKQEEMFTSMEAQYEVARTATHTMRGVGLGFGSFQR